jgi:hypothetical protein
VIVITVVVTIVYTMISLATGDWLWFSQKFSETPRAVAVHCHGETINFDPGSYHFKALNDIMNKVMSGRKNWDSLTLSVETYQDYLTDPQMVVVEFFYAAPLRVHSGYKFYSNVDDLIIPRSRRRAPFLARIRHSTAGALHVESTTPFKEYLKNQKICPVELNNN